MDTWPESVQCMDVDTTKCHDFTTVKAIVSDVWGFALSLGNVSLLIQYCLTVRNLAMPPEQALSKGARSCLMIEVCQDGRRDLVQIIVRARAPPVHPWDR